MKHDHIRQITPAICFTFYILNIIYFFPNLFKESGRFQFSAFRICVSLFHCALGLFFRLRFPFVSPGLLIPAELGWVARTGVYLCHCRWRIRAGMGVDGVLPQILHWWRMKASCRVLRLTTFFFLPFFCVFFALFSSLFFFYIRCCSRAISRYPMDYLPGWRNPMNELRFFTW